VLPFPSPGDLPDPGIETASPALQADSLLLSHQGIPKKRKNYFQIPLKLLGSQRPSVRTEDGTWNHFE